MAEMYQLRLQLFQKEEEKKKNSCKKTAFWQVNISNMSMYIYI